MYILILNCIKHKSQKIIHDIWNINIFDGDIAVKNMNINVQSFNVLQSLFILKFKKPWEI